MSSKTRRIDGPFIWERAEHQGNCEVWQLTNSPPESTRFVLKNYGGKPAAGNGFSGWRLVSSGPFGDGWETFEDALRGATTFLIDYYRREAKTKMAAARAILRGLTQFNTRVRAYKRRANKPKAQPKEES